MLDNLKAIEAVMSRYHAGASGLDAEQVLERIEAIIAGEPFFEQLTVEAVIARVQRIRRHVDEGDGEAAQNEKERLYQAVLSELVAIAEAGDWTEFTMRGADIARAALEAGKISFTW
jgi:hypothetical protein